MVRTKTTPRRKEYVSVDVLTTPPPVKRLLTPIKQRREEETKKAVAARKEEEPRRRRVLAVVRRNILGTMPNHVPKEVRCKVLGDLETVDVILNLLVNRYTIYLEKKGTNSDLVRKFKELPTKNKVQCIAVYLEELKKKKQEQQTV